MLAACGGVEPASTATTSGTPAATAATTLAPATEAPATTAAPAGSTVAPVAPVDIVEPLRVVAPLVTGGTADLSAFAARPTVFWFWAPG